MKKSVKRVGIGLVVILWSGALCAQSGGQASSGQADLVPRCVSAIDDQATGNCLTASSDPELGKLYPLGPELNIDFLGVQVGTPLHANQGIYVQGETHTFGMLTAHEELRAQGGVGIGSFLLGSVEADLHMRSLGDVELLLEADAFNNDEFAQPSLTFSQDGGAVTSRIGFFGGSNDFAISNLFDGDMEFDLPGGNADWEFWKLAGLAVDRKAYINNLGNMAIDGSYSSGGADVAEFYPLASAVEPADVVAFTGDGITIARAVTGAGGRLAGIVSSDPGVVLGLTYTDEDEIGENPEDVCSDDRLAAIRHEIQVNRRAPLALTGRVPCKVTAANGPIRPGDLLTVSDLPGHAMRATQAGAVIGTALEAWSHGEGEILVLANLGWFTPDLSAEHARLKERLEELERRVDSLSRR